MFNYEKFCYFALGILFTIFVYIYNSHKLKTLSNLNTQPRKPKQLPVILNDIDDVLKKQAEAVRQKKVRDEFISSTGKPNLVKFTMAELGIEQEKSDEMHDEHNPLSGSEDVGVYSTQSSVSDPEEREETRPEKPKQNQLLTKQSKTLIITSYRSGSTFLGELFNQHNDSFYFFEPLVALDESSNRGSSAKHYTSSYNKAVSIVDDDYPAKILLLQKLLTCDLPQWTWASKYKFGKGLMTENYNISLARSNV